MVHADISVVPARRAVLQGEMCERGHLFQRAKMVQQQDLLPDVKCVMPRMIVSQSE